MTDVAGEAVTLVAEVVTFPEDGLNATSTGTCSDHFCDMA
jgi:hypothetical protein